jgi:hypothetical protein
MYFKAGSGGSCLQSSLLKRQRLGGSKFEVNLGKKLGNPCQPGTVVCACHPSYVEAIGRRIRVQGWLWDQNGALTGKITWTKARRAGGVAQALQHLPSKYKALEINPIFSWKNAFCSIMTEMSLYDYSDWPWWRQVRENFYLWFLWKKWLQWGEL